VKADFLTILKVLREHGVNFIVVGGVCGVLHGAPIATFDLDIVHSRTSENLDCLLRALQELDARYRGQGARIIRPERSHLSSPGHQLLITRAGPLDLLGVIGSGRGYEELFDHGGNGDRRRTEGSCPESRPSHQDQGGNWPRQRQSCAACVASYPGGEIEGLTPQVRLRFRFSDAADSAFA
jgi:hypothetical protein